MMTLDTHTGHGLAAEFARLLADQAELNLRAFRLMQLACAGGGPIELADPRLEPKPRAVPSPEPAPEPTAAPPREGPARLAAAFAARRDAQPAEPRTSEGRRILLASTPTPEPAIAAPRAPRPKGEALAVVEPTEGSQRWAIYRAWAESTDTAAEVSRRLQLGHSVVCARLSEGRKANAPLVLAGDTARGRAPAASQAAPANPSVSAKPIENATRKAEALTETLKAIPAAVAGISTAVVRVPPVTPAPAPPRRIDEIGPGTRPKPGEPVPQLTPRPPARPILPKNTAPKPPPEPLPPCSNPVQIRARAELRNRVLDHYEANGDHPNVTARKLGTTLREVEWFIHDARQASDKRVRLGDVRRARQERAGR